MYRLLLLAYLISPSCSFNCNLNYICNRNRIKFNKTQHQLNYSTTQPENFENIEDTLDFLKGNKENIVENYEICLFNTKNVKNKVKIVKQLEKTMKIPISWHNHVLISSKFMNLDFTLDYFDRMEEKDLGSFNAVLAATSRAGKWKIALKLLDQCSRTSSGKATGGLDDEIYVLEPDVITYTNVMRACIKGGQPQRALLLFEVCQDKKIELDVFAYTCAIDACSKCKGRQYWKTALSLLDEMRTKGITPNEVTYAVSITACGSGGEWQRSLELLHQMKAQNMNINLRTYNAVLTALSKSARLNRFDNMKGGDDNETLWKRALALLDEMEEKGITPDNYSLSSAINICGFGGRWEEAVNILQAMDSPNKVAYTAAMSACARQGKWEIAYELFQKMEKAGMYGDRLAFNALLLALGRGNKDDLVFMIWNQMLERAEKYPSAHIDPNIVTVTDVITALDKAGIRKNWGKIDTVFAEAVRREILLPSDSLDSKFEIDLSRKCFPVSRAACRFIFKRIKDSYELDGELEDIVLITGMGKHRFGNIGVGKDGHHEGGHLGLREFVAQVLREEYDPPLYSSSPASVTGTIIVKKENVKRWIDSQKGGKGSS